MWRYPVDDLTHSAFVAEQTIEFISRQGNNPYLCIAGFYSPHAPWVAPQKYLDLYDLAEFSLPNFPPEIDCQRPRDDSLPFSDAQLRRAKQGYFAMITEVDDCIGKILAAVDASGQREDTIIVFTADHGEWLGSHLKYSKGYPADDSVSRVPLIISAPDASSERTCSTIVEAVDIVPTLLSLAGIQIPPALQGESLADVVRQGDVPTKGFAMTEGNGWKCLRTPRYRYSIHADGRESHWDIDIDPGEYHDVSADTDYQVALSECRRLLLRRLLEIERPRRRSWVY